MDIEASTSSITLLPTKKNPFTVIKSFLPKTISEKIAAKTNQENTDEVNDDVASDVSDSEMKIGSALLFSSDSKKAKDIS